MEPLKPSQFNEFFKALYGENVSPFPWQQELAERVATATDPLTAWPQALALPTASGKTACIDIAVFALACQYDWGERRTAPRRIFFVVDRRVIVDEAYDRTAKLARRLAEPDEPILRIIADRLRTLGSGDDADKRARNPLECFQLRGGVYRDDAWARTPIQPTVIASTVDQIGSRLLYRGYGLRSGLARPIHAGLAGNDCLILLDEAHCAVPFGQTVAAVKRYREWAEVPVRSPFVFVPMSATVRTDNDSPLTDVLHLSDRDRANETLGKRLTAAKPARFVVATKAKGARTIDRLAEELVTQAVRLTAAGTVKRLAVMVNRVATARKAAALLKEQGHDVVLLTGRMRPYDRDRLMDDWTPANIDKPLGLRQWLAAKEEPLELAKPVFVVATQCLEVGANLDFEGMVTECASLDALRQRFGRLDRLGLRPGSPGVIVVRADQVDGKESDPVYGNALAATWGWLQSLSAGSEAVDMGIDAMGAAIETARTSDPVFPQRLQPPTRNAPIMLPGHVDCWVQTAPAPIPEPDVALFLHGPDSGTPDVRVCWRADLEPIKSDDPNAPPLGGDEQDAQWLKALALCPPTSAECMPVPLPTFCRWMHGERPDLDQSDVEGVALPEGDDNVDQLPEQMPFGVIRWLGPEKSRVVYRPSDIRPRDTLVLPVSARGFDSFGHIPERPTHSPPFDVADAAFRRARSKAILRLHPALIDSWVKSPATVRLVKLIAQEELNNRVSESEFAEELREVLEALSKEEVQPSWLKESAAALCAERLGRFRRGIQLHPNGGLVLQGTMRLRPKGDDSETFPDEDDTASATVEVALANHCKGVAAWAETFAIKSGLSAELIADLVLAAQLHDLGKADSRFQALLHGGSASRARRYAEQLAKSGGMPLAPAARKAARERSGYPAGGRHELLSVALARKAADALAKAYDRDLVLHLIASHHGHCRPFAPVIDDKQYQHVATTHDSTTLTVTAEEQRDHPPHGLDSGTADRFWRLVRRYGWWGLAQLEATLRLADHRCSEAEQENAEKKEKAS